MFDINIYTSDKKSLKEIKEKLDKIISLLEGGSEIEGLDDVIEDLDNINEQVKTIV